MSIIKKMSLRDTMRSMKAGDIITVDVRNATLESARVQASILKRKEGIVIRVKKCTRDKYELIKVG